MNGRLWFDLSSVAITPTIGSGVFISTSTGAYLSDAGVWTDAPGTPQSYDSGWLPMSVGTNYDLDHNLGTTKLIVMAYGAKDSVGSGMSEFVSEAVLVGAITTTSCSVWVRGSGDLCWDGTTDYTPSYVRVILLRLD